MPRNVFVFDPPDRFVAGTVGQPGDRTFYLQASGGGRTVSVALEKVQVRVLAERLEELLETARRAGGDIPAAAGEALEDTAPLDAVVSSPLDRCLDTAGAILQGREQQLQVDDRLGECRYGDWTGRPLK
ncbi:MAG TPA: DUF3090 family protein, partial [Mycobacteriales bacterium]|nr:DUF3090 family protein [Mycobacteriales bacterium]